MKTTFEQSELNDFASNAKFKTSKSGSYLFFTVDEQYQIRIYKNKKNYSTITPPYSVTVNEISDDGITYNPYKINRTAQSLKESKLIAAEYYFKIIRDEL